MARPAMDATAPILSHPTEEPSVFLPENLLSRATVLKGPSAGIWRGGIPACCVLDFDGELVPVAREKLGARPSPAWACFHTTLLVIETGGFEMGLIGGTVGAPFAVLVAEQLISSGCRHIVGYSSAGAITEGLGLPCLVVPDRALRDEGTSYHYLAPAAWVDATGELPTALARRAVGCGLPVHRGPTWTTDAPYRETESQIVRHRAAGVLSVEMEAAALMALARTRDAEIASLLHVTNTLGTGEADFHKGAEDIHARVLACCREAFAEVVGQEAQP